MWMSSAIGWLIYNVAMVNTYVISLR
jgi:hypothetical protein